MGTVAGNVVALVRSRRTIKTYSMKVWTLRKRIILSSGQRQADSFRSKRLQGRPKECGNSGDQSRLWLDPEISRIQALENDYPIFRSMLDQMVRHNTEMLERRLSILKLHHARRKLSQDAHEVS